MLHSTHCRFLKDSIKTNIRICEDRRYSKDSRKTPGTFHEDQEYFAMVPQNTTSFYTDSTVINKVAL